MSKSGRTKKQWIEQPIDTTEDPFGRGWKIAMMVVFGVVLVALAVMIWIVATHQ